ncbi:cytochrome-c peroxidase [Paraliomyxa miuraensis]|uniref:cytochrome-c peroxidase n=1 Tax=Paraliomyxa miuraensis TaxID=376150 RepID=UPI00225C102D|nr:cytochrome c peroxidase [Paraliomyxa miuraensis]MCX4240956.1 hypothetical protein [Paraliomyxa miuraensis]
METTAASTEEGDATTEEPSDPDSGSSTGAEPHSPDPTPEEWALLQTLRYDEGPPPADVTNAWADDDAAALLGQALFFDPRFSGPLLDGDNDGDPDTLGEQGQTGRVSCAGCHIPESGFSDTRSPHQQISLASGWVLRKTPSLLDMGWIRLLSWDGRRDTAYGSLFGALENPLEFNGSRLFMAQQLHAHHREAFEDVFGPMEDFSDPGRFPPLEPTEAGCDALNVPVSECRGKPGDEGPYDGMADADRFAVDRVVVQAGKAIGAYMRRLRCGSSEFDAWLDGGEPALSDAARRGARWFVGEGHCIDCHGGPLLSDHSFHNVGLLPAVVATVFIDDDDPGAIEGIAGAIDDPLNSRSVHSDGDDGRLPRDVDRSMLGAFKTPSLRCVDLRPSFMHTGQYRTLEQVVGFFAEGGHPVGYPGVNELQPTDLDAQQRADLVAFLEALRGPGPDPSLLEPPATGP